MPLVVSTAIAGIAAGGAYALLGLTTVFTYRYLAVVNFAQTAIGAVGAYVTARTWDHGTSLVAAIALGMAVAGALQGVVGFGLTRWFSEGTELVKAAVTIAILGALVAAGDQIFASPTAAEPFPVLAGGSAFTVANVTITWQVVVTCAAAVALAAGASAYLSRTYGGLLLRAMAARPTTAELMSVPVTRIAMVVWTASGAVTGFAMILLAPQLASSFDDLALLITSAFAAALLGAFRSFWRTLFGGLLLGVGEGAINSASSLQAYRSVLPLVVILALLVWTHRGARLGQVA